MAIGIAAIAVVIGLVSSGIGLGLTLVPTLGRDLGYWANEQRPTRQPSPPDFIEFRRREIIDEEEYNLLMSREGFNEERATQFWNASTQILGFGDLLTLYRRGELSSDAFLAGATQLGFTPEITAQLVKAAEFFPSVGDMVRFAVREVYTPEIVSKFELDADLPSKFIEEAAKAGLPEEQARNYWRSHWVLPSVGLGYEMLHRGIIEKPDLELLLKTQDVMPFWRPKLIDLSYTPYTRVDVRRMYQTGVLKKEDVYRSYLDIGYDPIKAEKMTEFTIAYSEPTERELTRTMILDGFEQGEITREETVTYLTQIGYDADNADYIVSLEENKWAKADLKLQTDTLGIMFKDGLISQEYYISELDKLNLKASYRNKLVVQALTQRRASIKLPTKADVQDWFKKELITEETFRIYYDKLGYSETDVNLYVQAIQHVEKEAA